MRTILFARPFALLPSIGVPLAFGFSLVIALASAPSARASDGVLEINQTCAVQTGCFAGDAAGFPVTIATGGSYRLTGSLTLADENTTTIVVSASGATLDLGGFEIRGPNVCTGTPTTCTLSGSGFGVQLTGNRVRVANGAITGVGSVGLYGPATPTSGEGHVVEDLRTTQNRFEGIRLDGDVARVRGVASTTNGGSGLLFNGSGSVVSDSILSKNGLDGVQLGVFCTVQASQIVSNGRFGLLSSGTPNYYRDNTISGNASSAIVGGAVNAGGNVCTFAVCP